MYKMNFPRLSWAVAWMSAMQTILAHRHQDASSSVVQTSVASSHGVDARDFPEYSNVKKISQRIRQGSQQIHDGLTDMAHEGGVISDMLEKSEDYKNKVKTLHAGVQKLERNDIPIATKHMADETAQGMREVADADVSDAFTSKDRDMIDSYSNDHPEELTLLKEGLFPKESVIRDADMGKDPYHDMHTTTTSPPPTTTPPPMPTTVMPAEYVYGSDNKKIVDDESAEQGEDEVMAKTVIHVPDNTDSSTASLVEIHKSELE